MNTNVTIHPRVYQFLKVWSKAEKQNDSTVQFKLAQLYSLSDRADSASKAFALYKKVTKSKRYTKLRANAVLAVGKCYENGYGVRRSYQQAIEWYKRVDGAIFDDFQHNPDPLDEALSAQIKCYAENGELDQMLVYNDERIESEMAAAELGDSRAQNFLSNLYCFGGEVEQSYEKAAYWAKKAAENGDATAQIRLGSFYFSGQGVKKNEQMALYLWRKAAIQGRDEAMFSLGKYYESVKQYKEGAKWFRSYAETRIEWRNERLGWKN